MLRLRTIVIILITAFALSPDCDAQSIVEDSQYRSEIIIDARAGDTIQTYFYPNGTKRAVGQLMNGMREGEWTLWYGNGRIWLIGNYHQNQIEGKWRFWNDGLVVEAQTLEGQLVDGARHGRWYYYYPNGNIEVEGDWNMEQQTGMWTYRYEGNQLKRIENWANGLRDGRWEFWHVNGQQEREETHNGDIKHGTWTYWYNNGNLERKENWQGGRKHGLWTFWYRSGQIEMQGTFVNDVAFGEWTVWYENGEKKMEGNLQANTMEDDWTYWYPNSERKAKVTYNKGDIINIRFLRPPPVNYDRRPDVISGNSGNGYYKRPASSTSSLTTLPEGQTSPMRAFDGINDPVTTPTLTPNNSQNTERVSGFQQSTGSAVLEKSPGN